MRISHDLLDELPNGCKRPEDLLGETWLMMAIMFEGRFDA